MTRSSVVALSCALLALAEGARLSAQAVGREIAVSALDSQKFLPKSAYNALHQEFFVVWTNSWGAAASEIHGARLDRFGRVIATYTLGAGGNSRTAPAVAYDASRDRYLVLWMYDYYGDFTDWDLRGRLVPWNGPDPGLTELTLWDTTDSQWYPKVAYASGSDEFFVVWANSATPPLGTTVSLGMVTAGGAVRYATTLAGDTAHNYLDPDLVYNAWLNEGLVVYEIDQSDVAARRISFAGALGSELMVAGWPDPERNPAVASCTEAVQWLVVWQSDNPDPNLYARFLLADGSFDGGPLEIAPGALADQAPAVACLPGGGDRYLITWEEEWGNGPLGISGRQVDTSHALLDPGFAIREVPAGQIRDAFSAAVAGGELGWSVAWVQEREGSTYSDILAAMVWALFADDFETGNTSLWSSVSP